MKESDNGCVTSDEEKSRGNFADFAVLPDDHGQAALAKFDAFFSGGATVRLGCNASIG